MHTMAEEFQAMVDRGEQGRGPAAVAVTPLGVARKSFGNGTVANLPVILPVILPKGRTPVTYFRVFDGRQDLPAFPP